MIKNVTKFFLTSTAIFGLTQVFATETYPFFLEREDGTILEGYFSPPMTNEAPIIFAIQGSSCQSVLKWSIGLSDQASLLGLGVITLEEISHDDIDLLELTQASSLEQRQKDYEFCLRSMHSIYPEWEGKPIFWGESEGGVLAANLAVQEPKTAAVLLFATDAGMKPREEVNSESCYRCEEQRWMQEEGDRLDVQLDEGSRAEHATAPGEVIMPLSQQSLPICLVHGVEDSQIPVESADLMAQMLAKTNPLTYLRLEGHGHDLATADVQNAACQWLGSILLQQEGLGDSYVQVGVARPSLIRPSSKDAQMASSNYVLCRDPEDSESGMGGRGDVSAGISAEKDSNGNERISGDLRYSRDFGNGVTFDWGATGSCGKDRDGNIKAEGKIEGRVKVDF